MGFEIQPIQVITDTTSTGIPDGGTQNGGGQANALQLWTIAGVDATATGQTLLLPAQTGHIIVLQAVLELASIGGSGTVPTITIGNNGSSYNNVVTATPLTGLTTVNTLFPLTLAAGIKAIDISAVGLKLNISVAALVYSPYSLNLYLTGYIR